MALARRQRQIIARGNGRWLVCISICRDHRTRRRKKLEGIIRDDVRAAQRILISRPEESDQARELDAARQTLNQYPDRWLELAVRLKLRAKSFADYEALLRRHIRSSLGERGLLSLALLDFQKVYHQMRESGLSENCPLHPFHSPRCSRAGRALAADGTKPCLWRRDSEARPTRNASPESRRGETLSRSCR